MEKLKILITNLQIAIYWFRQQNYHKGYEYANMTNQLLQEVLEDLQKNGYEEDVLEYCQVLEAAIEMIERQDGIGLADVFEDWLLPMVYQTISKVFFSIEDPLIDYWGKNRRLLKKKDALLYRYILENRDTISDAYQLSWAKTGDLVLEKLVDGRGIHLNSSISPCQEAIAYYMRIKDDKYKKYLIVGLGLGYHIEIMRQESEIEKITILENDISQLAIAFSYRDLTSLLQDSRVEIIYCPEAKDYSNYLSEVSDDTKCCIWYPSIQTIRKNDIREILEDYWIEISATENMFPLLVKNFYDNQRKEDEEVTGQKSVFMNKKMILVAAGPSVDENLEWLKKRNQEETVLVCVGKAASKSLSSGVDLDYIVMTDGLPSTKKQISGIEDCGVPLIYLSTVASDVVENYQGKRYVAYQQGFEPAEKYAEEKEYTLFQSGGSVATFALDFGIRMGCKQIICVGLDLGYPGEQTHAEGVGRKIADFSQLRRVEGVCSEYVYTNKPMDIYRKWIERRIEGEKSVEYINASKGARIHGMIEKDLKDCL